MKSAPEHFPDWIARAKVRQARRLAHPGARRGRGDARLPGRAERRHAAHLARRASTSRASPTGSSSTSTRRPASGSRRCAPPRATRATRLRDAGLAPFAMVTRLARRARRLPAAARAVVHGRASVRRALAEAMVARRPASRLTLEWHKTERGDRSSSTSTASTTPSTRSRPTGCGRGRGPRWPCRCTGTSCRTGKLRARPLGRAHVVERVQAQGDPWKGIARRARGV